MPFSGIKKKNTFASPFDYVVRLFFLWCPPSAPPCIILYRTVLERPRDSVTWHTTSASLFFMMSLVFIAICLIQSSAHQFFRDPVGVRNTKPTSEAFSPLQFGSALGVLLHSISVRNCISTWVSVFDSLLSTRQVYTIFFYVYPSSL